MLDPLTYLQDCIKDVEPCTLFIKTHELINMHGVFRPVLRLRLDTLETNPFNFRVREPANRPNELDALEELTAREEPLDTLIAHRRQPPFIYERREVLHRVTVVIAGAVGDGVFAPVTRQEVIIDN
jgi:hypothetical protein